MPTPLPTDPLVDEVISLARDLIRVDTSNFGPGRCEETPAARLLAEHLEAAGVECELVAREPGRANLVARLPGSGAAPSLAFVGHLDVVPADARDWTHPPFAAVVDDDGYLYGRGAVDMKNEVAARAVALASLAREGFRPAGDLWLLAVADEEDGRGHVGMNWLVNERPDIRPAYAINEGGGLRYTLADGRTVVEVSVGEKGTLPVVVTALGEAGHASMPTVGRNAVPLLGEVLRRIGDGLPQPSHHEVVDAMLAVLLDREVGPHDDLVPLVAQAAALHPQLEHALPALVGTTMAPTLLEGSSALNVMPARASVTLDCRLLPGTDEHDVDAAVLARLEGLDVELDHHDVLVPGNHSPASGPLWDAVRDSLHGVDPGARLLPTMSTGFTDSVYLRRAWGTVAYGFNPFRVTPADVVEAGYHNRDERVHVDDLVTSTHVHRALARRLLG